MRMVTRTIKSIVVVTKCVNTDTMEVEDHTFTIANHGKATNPTKIINKSLANSPLKLVKVIETREETAKYKMPEDVFILNATVVE